MIEHSRAWHRAIRRRRRSRITLIAFTFLLLLICLIMFKHTEKMTSSKAIANTTTNTTTQSLTSKIPDAVKNALQGAILAKHPDLLRKFPYPFNAMLAISSDADMTTLEEFEEYHRFLNTKEQTPYGEGLGLDIGDSTWFYIANDTSEKVDKDGHSVDYSMSYFQGVDPQKLKDSKKIVHYFKVGWIDSLHTFGDFSRNDHLIKFTRSLAVAAWDAMNQSGFKPEVWINHGSETNVQNFGVYNSHTLFKYQQGDNPKSPYYHTDLTLKNGIRYVWNSMGGNQFSYDDPLFPLHLRDGQNVWGFYRYTNELNKGKIDWTWETQFISRQITKTRLDQLVQEGKYSVVTQHLGKGSNGFPFTKEGIQTLHLLKTYNDEGKILVARTSRLLDYARSHKYVHYSVVQLDGKTYININSIDDLVLGSTVPSIDDIRGLTFYVNDPSNTCLLLNLNPISTDEIQYNSQDGNGKKSIEIKWYKPDYTDYTKEV
ncbi:hypothetical protein [Desulfosporosinus sp. SB140]|uniref:hypothetical protein n=1 Tax=Desulfosporosinus paludis TaxID=3115649 RepID=UPI00388F1C9F